MVYTAKQLKKALEGISDDTEICIERIEDVYFEKHNWETETKDWDKNNPGLETTVYMPAFGVVKIEDNKKFIIVAHY